MLGALLNNTSRVNAEGNDVLPLWNGDGMVPPDHDGESFSGSHNHYVTTGASSLGQSDIDDLMDTWAAAEPGMRAESGPPGDYDPTTFGQGNIYYGPALMWHELRQRIGDDVFWDLVRRWPEEHDNGNASYDEITRWWSDQTGEDLQPFFDEWLLGATTPDRS